MYRDVLFIIIFFHPFKFLVAPSWEVFHSHQSYLSALSDCQPPFLNAQPTGARVYLLFRYVSILFICKSATTRNCNPVRVSQLPLPQQSTPDTIVLSRFSAYIMCFREHSFSDEIYTIIYIILLYIVIPIHRFFIIIIIIIPVYLFYFTGNNNWISRPIRFTFQPSRLLVSSITRLNYNYCCRYYIRIARDDVCCENI